MDGKKPYNLRVRMAMTNEDLAKWRIDKELNALQFEDTNEKQHDKTPDERSRAVQLQSLASRHPIPHPTAFPFIGYCYDAANLSFSSPGEADEDPARKVMVPLPAAIVVI